MRYFIKQKLFSFSDDFSIQDADGQPAYYVDGKMFSLGNQLSFQDGERRELAFIRQRLLSWGPTYEIYRNETLVAAVRKHLLTLLHCRFTVDVPGPDDWEAEGNLTDHEYTFRRGERVVATVSKHWVALADTYGIDIAAGEDDVLLLASAVVIDLVCHADQKH